MKLAIATGTRADWGLLSPLADSLKNAGNEILIYATNMHLLTELGDTWKEIEADGFPIKRKIPAEGGRTRITADALSGFGKALAEDNPDALIILGDRFEMLGAASAASLEGIPIIHIAGGTVSEGAIDDSIRHVITKLSTLHLVETELCRRRVIQMGESPERVIHTGAIGVYNALSVSTMTKDDFERSVGFHMPDTTFLITLHPATLSTLTPERQYDELLSALERFPEYGYLITYPNNDTDPTPLIRKINAFAEKDPERRFAIPSLGRKRYMSALRYVKGVIGNSSSGIVEVPSTGIPTLDIGIRQKGREHGPSVSHCGDTVEEIASGIELIMSENVRDTASRRVNPYYMENTPAIMTDAIMSYHFSKYPIKRFYDVRF